MFSSSFAHKKKKNRCVEFILELQRPNLISLHQLSLVNLKYSKCFDRILGEQNAHLIVFEDDNSAELQSSDSCFSFKLVLVFYKIVSHYLGDLKE